ncbi:hypothetical protein GNI_186920 [Gregarina niphandrodes]|uniref:Uncharacterized protein n=1 Tax=Gregarina niphandrodes TaxID=110365 RepID=A0A023AX06_GRENI|nr:hypothetical protein GNI_186920 [Gregarina niphandrodes]EZG43117.1 hypothetical protein GNI_186920 [Gregarina niphandrodes]|eukprot:XP_011133629.1 hypothetical protein GNI_186920 [Gregarina niphandrodes]
MRTCVASPDSSAFEYVWLSYMQKMLCDGDWSQLPDSVEVGMFRLKTLRNLWQSKLWADGEFRPSMGVYAVVTTAGQIRSLAKACSLRRDELLKAEIRQRWSNDRQPKYIFKDHIKYLDQVSFDKLCDLSCWRLRWYANHNNSHLFNSEIWWRGKKARSPLLDRVLKGEFTAQFGPNEILVAVTL